MSASRSERAPLRTTLFALIALLTLAWAAAAQATTVLRESFPDLVEKSEGIVVGTLLAKESRYGADRAIYTFWTLGDLQIVSGAYAEPQLELRVLGGEVDGDRLSVVGAPSFAIGDRVVLFLRGNGRYPVPFVGWTQGVFRVGPDGAIADHEGNRLLGIQNLELEREQRTAPAIQIVDRPGSQAAPAVAASTGQATEPRPSLTLDRFVKAIQEQAARSRHQRTE